MGNCLAVFYRRKFVVDEEVEGQGSAALEVFTLLGLSPNDIDLLYTAFWDIDADGSGLIRPSELFSYFEVEGTRFEKGVFSLFDEDNSGMINFMEFVCTLWNLLTLPESDYGALAFLIKDPTAVGTINYADVRELLEMMHSKKVDKDPALSAVYTKMRRELGNAFSIHEFNKWTAANPHVVTPIMMLQLHIRLQIIGEPFWMKLAVERKEHPEQGQLDYVKRLQDFVLQKNSVFKERLALEEAERRRLRRLGRGKMGDCRDNVTRKQSVLLGYFNMKQTVPEGLGRQGKSLSRVFVLTDDLEDDGVEIAGGQSASGKRRPANNTNHNNSNAANSSGSAKLAASSSSQKVSQKATANAADPFLESNIRTKPAPNTTTTSSTANSSASGEGINTSASSKQTPTKPATNNTKAVVRTIVAADGNNRARRSSITLQKPNLVRDLGDKKKKKEDKYKKSKKSTKKNSKTRTSNNSNNKKQQSVDDNSDSEDDERDYAPETA